MSKTGIYLIYAALAGAVVAAIFGGLLIHKRAEDAAVLAQTQQEKAASDQSAKKARSEADAAVQAKKDSDGKLAEASGKLETLNGQLADTKKQADDAKAALTQAQADTEKAKADLASLNDKLKGQSIDDIIAARTKAETDLASSQSAQKVLEDNVQGLDKKVADLTDAINRKKDGTMPGVSGRVTFVNHTWNFVVLDVGLSNGVVPNGELIVYRKNSFLGKVKITSVEANSAVGDILPDVKGDIQIGDYVLN